MARDGREFERLIEKLERLVASSDVEIIRNAKLIDKRTGGEREIDILLKAKVAGSHDINIIIECRNRNANPDVKWIDEIATKRNAVGAHKAVAISSIPLTKKALKAAEAENIAVRTVSALNISDVSQWFQAKVITVVQPRSKVRGVSFEVCGCQPIDDVQQKAIEKNLKKILDNKTKAYLFDRSTKTSHTLATIWANSVKIPPNVVKKLEGEPKGTSERVVFTINLKKTPFEIVDMKGFNVCKILFRVEVTIEIKEYSPTEILKYAENQDSLSEIIRFKVEVDGRDIDIDFVKNSKGLNVAMSNAKNVKMTYKIAQSS